MNLLIIINKHKVKEKISVFIGPTEIAGFYTNLNRGLLELGYNSNYLGKNYQSKNYEIHGSELLFVKLYKIFKNKAQDSKIIYKQFFNISSKFCFVPIIIQILWKIDVIIFGFNTSLLPLKFDYFLYKLFGKKVILGLFHGSEARPPFLDGVNFDRNGKFIGNKEIFKRVKMKTKMLNISEKYASYIIAAPTNCQYLSKSFINFFNIGLAVYVQEKTTPQIISNRKIINILHAPSNMNVKGTYEIRKVINSLKKKFDINYIELHGKPIEEVYEWLAKTDLVIDQIYSDHPMAGLATEAAFFGVPSLVGGYELRYIQQNYIPNEMVPPTFICSPFEIENKLEEIINCPELLIDMGQKAQNFVLNQWSYIEVAKRFVKIFNNEIPLQWILDPEKVVYTAGGGLSEEMRCKIIRNYIEEFGVNALRLKPATRVKLLGEIGLIND